MNRSQEAIYKGLHKYYLPLNPSVLNYSWPLAFKFVQLNKMFIPRFLELSPRFLTLFKSLFYLHQLIAKRWYCYL